MGNLGVSPNGARGTRLFERWVLQVDRTTREESSGFSSHGNLSKSRGELQALDITSWVCGETAEQDDSEKLLSNIQFLVTSDPWELPACTLRVCRYGVVGFTRHAMESANPESLLLPLAKLMCLVR